MKGHAGRVLDLGGGVGATSLWLKEQNRADRLVLADLVADQALPAVDAALAGNLEDPALWSRIDQEAPFDTILCLDVLEHLKDPWSAVERLHAMLAPGGAIVACLPNMRNLKLVLPLVLRGRFELEDDGVLDRTHLRWFTRHSAITLLTGSGLELEKIEGKTMSGWHTRLADRLTLGLFRSFFEYQYLVRVRNTGEAASRSA